MKNICECGLEKRFHLPNLLPAPCKKFRPQKSGPKTDLNRLKPKNHSPLKKGENEAPNSSHLETRSKAGEDNREERMPVDTDNQEDTSEDMGIHNPVNSSGNHGQLPERVLGMEEGGKSKVTRLDGTPSAGTFNLSEKIDAIFEMFQILDEKITEVNNRFSRLAKELGYKV